MKPFWRATKQRWILPYLDAARVQRQHVIPSDIAPTGRSRRQAEEYAAGWIARQKETGAVPPVRRPTDGPAVRGLRERWVQLRRRAVVDGVPRYKPATLDDYEEHLDSRVLKASKREVEDGLTAIGDVPLTGLDVQRARAWVRALAAEVSPYRCRNVYSTLRSLVDDAIAEGWVQILANPFSSPAVLRELPEGRRTTGIRPVVIELDHVQRAIACPDVPELRRVRYLVDAASGLSEGELAGRIWTDADLGDHPFLVVSTSLATRGPEGWATIGSTKNEHRMRTVPLHSAAAEALRWWKAEGWADYVGRPPRLTDPIFPGPEGGFSRPASAELLRRDLRAAGCPDTCNGHRVTAQALRRCFSSFMDAVGVPEEVRGRLMGHAARSVTAKHYTAAALERDRLEVEKIPLRWVPVRAATQVAGVIVAAAAPVTEAAPLAAWIGSASPAPASSLRAVPVAVPGPVPAAQELVESSEPPSRLELETYGLRKRPCSVPVLDVRGPEVGASRSAAPTTNGTPTANGAENVPETLAACAGAVVELARRWDALEAMLVQHAGVKVPELAPVEVPPAPPPVTQNAPAISIRPQAALTRIRLAERGARPGPGLARGRLRGRPLDDVAVKGRGR